ncbi:MAG: toll/interleukin-1 receptor domain-containing protein, partial [Magnetococcales bacterium]|nr:toll/interleukin-1 receptor domain-containing protein [Magnetococcales bacterium]
MPLKLFICYAIEDKNFREQFANFATPLAKKNIISLQSDVIFELGKPWKEEIIAAMMHCDAALLFVSESFLASAFIDSEEFPRLLTRWKSNTIKLLPIMLYQFPFYTNPLTETDMYYYNNIPIGNLPYYQRDNAWIEIANQLIQWSNLASPSISPTDYKCDTSKLPLPATTLVGRHSELETLTRHFNDPTITTVGIVAGGGVGKSGLTVAWLAQLKERNFDGAKMIFGWSFYSQGQHETQTSSTQFFSEALRFFNYKDSLNIADKDKATELAKLLARQPSLLILDGVEPLQHPTNVLGGEFKDPGLFHLLRILGNNGLRNNSSKSLILLS